MQAAKGASAQALVHVVLHNKQVRVARVRPENFQHVLDTPAQHAARQ